MPELGLFPPSRITPKGKVVVVGTFQGFQGTDNVLVQDSTVKSYWDELIDYPIEQRPDGTLIPNLATSWTVSGDQSTWVFAIQDGMIFHNGSPVTAEDVAWTWNRAIFGLEGEGAIGGWGIELSTQVSSISTAGNTVLVKTPEPNGLIPTLFTSFTGSHGAVALSKSYFEAVGLEEFRDKFVGTGPYSLERRVPGQFVELKANEDHFRKAPGFETVQVWDVGELTTRIAMLRVGQADLSLASLQTAQDLRDAGFNVVTAPGSNVSWMLFHHADVPGNPFGDKRVREALITSIDRAGIANALYLGLAEPANQAIAVPGNLGYNLDLEEIPYDLDRARQLLADAGWSDLRVKIRTFDSDADFPDMPTMSEAITGGWEEIGVTATINVMETRASFDFMSLGAKDAEVKSKQVEDEPPYTLFIRGTDTRFHTFRFMDIWFHSEGRFGMMQQPDLFDVRLDEMRLAFTLEEQDQGLQDFQQFLTDEFWQAPLLRAGTVFGMSDRIAEWQPTVGRPLLNNLWTLRPAQ